MNVLEMLFGLPHFALVSKRTCSAWSLSSSASYKTFANFSFSKGTIAVKIFLTEIIDNVINKLSIVMENDMEEKYWLKN